MAHLSLFAQHGRGSEGPVQRAAALVRPQVQARAVQPARHAHVPVPLRVHRGGWVERCERVIKPRFQARALTSKSYA